jgi:hypothetical protein
LLNWQPDVVTHRYRDFPMLQVPYLWNRFLDRAGADAGRPQERAHRDGITVSRESPEAFEEMLWMGFFPDLHDPNLSSVLDGATDNPAFETFYRDHIRKLLLLRNGRRYVSKGNYNVTRLEYLLRMFPDARFVVPVRNPYWHVASMIKQHRLFLRSQHGNSRAVSHLRRAGHFEFGVDRRPINTGEDERVRAITRCWQEGREVEGWARYWSMVYDHLARRLSANPALAEATLVLPYESLCVTPVETARLLFEHCGFEADPALLERARQRVHFPEYYRPELTEPERQEIARHTRDTAMRLRRHYAGVAAMAPEEPAETASVSD